MKIPQRVFYGRLTQLTNVDENQYGFIFSGKSAKRGHFHYPTASGETFRKEKEVARTCGPGARF